jgi:hypothetical protein
MSNDTDIKLCGSFTVKDANGENRTVKQIRIPDEGYGMLDISVDFTAPPPPLGFRDQTVVAAINKHLAGLGYKGPYLEPGEPGMQSRNMIVLEAGEAFCTFAKRHGWKDLTDEFNDM